MSRRRTFDIEAPAVEATIGQGPGAGRRGPMAAAVRETAAALSDRARMEATIRAENDALAEAHVAARRAGLLLESVDPDAIEDGWLIRDRAVARDPDIDALKLSIREIGLSNPIRLAALAPEDGRRGTPDGRRYALVQGWRRLAAWRELRAEGPGFDRIPAAIGPAEDAETLADAYRRMVDENLMRRDVSFIEMARLARAYADAHLEGDADAAVGALFRSAPPQKRSYIRNFVEVWDAVGGALAHPAALPRALGIALRARLRAAPDAPDALRHRLDARPDRDEATELALLRGFIDEAPPRTPAREKAPFPRGESLAPGGRVARAQTAGAAAHARDQRVTIRFRAPRGWTEAGLAAALEAFVAALDGPPKQHRGD